MDTLSLYNHTGYGSEYMQEEPLFKDATDDIKKELQANLDQDFIGNKIEQADILREHAKNWIPGRRGYQATREAIQGHTFANEELDALERLAYGSAGIITIVSLALLMHQGINNGNRGLGFVEQQALAKTSSMILAPAQAKVILRHHGEAGLEEFKKIVQFKPKEKLIGIIKKLQENLYKTNNPATQKLLQYCDKALFTLEYKPQDEIQNTTRDILEYYSTN